MLTRFGIKSTADALNGATVQNYLQKGNFQILFGILVGFAPPLDTLVGALVSYNFSSLGRGIGYNSNQTVPGLGKVNISKTLQKQFQTIGPGPQMDKLIAIWARFVNNNLPFLSITDRNVAIPYSTERYTDWPPSSSPLWKLQGTNYSIATAIMIEQGYVRPKT